MKNKDFEKYIDELSTELQEKARHCKNMDELNKLLADNDVELSEDALAAVAGGTGGSCTCLTKTTGEEVDYTCPKCGQKLRYWDRTSLYNRYYCSNPNCIACQENWLFGHSGIGNRMDRIK